MKKATAGNEQKKENLPFSFLKAEPDGEKIKKHWQRVKEKINTIQPQAKDAGEEN